MNRFIDKLEGPLLVGTMTSLTVETYNYLFLQGKDEIANIAALLALTLIPVIGIVGGEIKNRILTKRPLRRITF